MKIEYNPTFRKRAFEIWNFISKDSVNKADDFLNQLENKILELVYMPYKFRKSFYYDDENIRDLIFKGYTIPYYIDKKNDIILILDIFKWNKK